MLIRPHRASSVKAKLSKKTVLFCFFAVVLLVQFIWHTSSKRRKISETVPVGRLTREFVTDGRGEGGRWYIPPSWLQEATARHIQQPVAANATVLDAAERALSLATRQDRYLDNSRIPLIAHQTWRSLNADAWPDVVKRSVEQWLDAAVGDESRQMTWILWDDAGIDALIKKYEPELWHEFQSLPYPVEKADAFRIVVVKHFGGVYADVDARPLKHPKEWVYTDDLTAWVDTYTQATHTVHEPSFFNASVAYGDETSSFDNSRPINAIFGIEADNKPDPDTSYWRMGYSHPVQVTNWALAMAPRHPVASEFVSTLRSNITRNQDHLRGIDPLELTGPPALTTAVKTVAQREDTTLSWDALSGRNGDPSGGRGKVVGGDALILPITGFSPGRGWFQNMGSKPVTHRNARLHHAAAGSWKNMDLKVHYGKLCRQVFGMCKEWKKIPE